MRASEIPGLFEEMPRFIGLALLNGQDASGAENFSACCVLRLATEFLRLANILFSIGEVMQPRVSDTF